MTPVVIIGDSLACPRPWEGVGLAETYAYRLQAALGGSYYVVNWGMSENSSRRATSEGFLRTYLRGSGAGHVVVQLGIVDCAPRLMTASERVMGGIAARIPVLRGVYRLYAKAKSRHRYRITKMFPTTLVEIGEFERNMRALVEELLQLPAIRTVHLVNIAVPGDYLIARSYGILDNVRRYNAVLNALAASNPDKLKIVDIFQASSESPEWITPDDGHHILPAAHRWIADTIAASIRAFDS